jgi:uncharacterized protein with von Willebrand factor type A (vWA) domain
MTDEQTIIKALPTISTLKLSSPQRAIGRLAELALNGRPDGPAQEDLAGDAFYEMYLSDPQTAVEVAPERATNRALLNWMKSTHGWEAGRASTTANMPAAMTAASLMWNHLTNDETIKEALDKQEEASRAAQEARAKQTAADALQHAADATNDDALKTAANRMRAEAQAAQATAAAGAQAAQAMIEKAQASPYKNAAMAAAARKVAQEAKETAEAAAGWGMGPGSAVHSDPAAAIEFLRANSGNIRRIARLAGRMRGFAMQARRERSRRGHVPASAGMTQDLTRAFPTELALLRPDAPPILRAEKMAQFVEAGLLGYLPTADAEKRGTFVGAVDVSPSMHGSREIVAKAIALGVAQVAKQDGRPYILFAFASDADTITWVTSDDNWQSHLNWASASQRGGTDFDMALDETMKRVKELGKKAKGTDALFISDGEAGVSGPTAAAWNAFRQETGARLFYVPVNRYGGLIDIEVLADRVVKIGELDETTGAGLAGELGRWV